MAANTGLGQAYVTSLDCNSQNVVLAGTYDQGLFRLTSAGGTWVAANTGLGSLAILTVRAAGGLFLAGTSLGVYRSIDGGATWAGAGLSGQPTYDLAFDPGNTQHLWAGTLPQGVLASPDGGQTWTRLGALTQVYTVARDGAGTLFAGTQNSGAYSFDGSVWEAEDLGASRIYLMRPAGTGYGRVVAGTSDGIWAHETPPPTLTPTTSPTQTATATVTPEPNSTPGLRIGLQGDPQGAMGPDGLITYRIEYEPVGGDALSDVVITSSIPFGHQPGGWLASARRGGECCRRDRALVSGDVGAGSRIGDRCLPGASCRLTEPRRRLTLQPRGEGHWGWAMGCTTSRTRSRTPRLPPRALTR